MSSQTVIPPAGGRVVQGRVFGQGRQGLPDLFVEVVDRAVGGDVGVGASQTDDDGAFAVVVTHSTRPLPDLQARVWTGADPGAAFVGESAIAYDATETVVALDVRLEPGSIGLEAEYDSLQRAAAPFFPGRLGELQESGLRSDITHVAAKSGWDARGIALATLADRLAREADDVVAAPFYYSLLRSGLPSAPELLYRTSSRIVENVWHDAVERGVISRDLAPRITEAVEAFQRLATARLLATRATGLSSLEEILDLTFPGDADSKAEVAALQVRAQDAEAFWESVRSTLGDDAAQRLMLDSELTNLTLNNGPLVATLRASQTEDAGGALQGAADLARRGFHRPAQWLDLLDDSIPEVVPGDTIEQRRANYADFLAAQVRLSFPTAVIAAKLTDGELAVSSDDTVSDGVATFLRDNVGRFELGVESVRGFVAANAEVSLPDDPQVVEGIDRLHRVYQLTPDDDSLAVLLDQGLDSASAIAAIPAKEFIRARSDDLGEPVARLIHARAEQISEVVTNLATSYLAARTAQPIGADGAILSPYDDAEVATRGNPLPTLEGLFGSMNTESCEHCGSLLSPAAYLVDLLLFLDVDLTGVNPLQKLLERRPDIGVLPLTCENTNTLVPHIDLVTETLEHYVTHGLSLQEFSGHTTPRDQTSQESLARPSFVDDAAYDLLRQTWYPAPLPFHRHLEDLRALLSRLGVSLAEALCILRRNDEVAPDDAYGWREITREQAGVSAPMARVLAERALPLPELLGYAESATGDDVLTDLGTVRGWATRLNLTYDEVDRLLHTRFVNPGVLLTRRLRLLGVDDADLKRLKDGKLTPAQFRAVLPDDLDEQLYGGDVVAWVKDDARYRLIAGLLAAVPPAPAPDDQLRILPPFDEFVLRRVDADGAEQAITPVVARRLVRFVRLWRALGWSVEATDTAAMALLSDRADAHGVVTGEGEAELDEAMDTLVGRLGTVAAVLRRLSLDPARDLQALLACWSDLETWGPDAIYRQLFVVRGGHDAEFGADDVGEFLARPPLLRDRLDAVRAALGVSAEDLDAARAGLPVEVALDLATVSMLFRRTWLARTVGLGQHDFERLLGLTGIDPFGPPDQPHCGLLELLDLLDGLAASGVTPEAAATVLAPAEETTVERLQPMLLRLGRDVRQRRRTAATALQTGDPVSAERAGELLELRFGPAGRHFAALVGHALDVEVPFTSDTPLSPSVVEAGGGRLSVDRARQRLAYAGVMTEATRDAITSAGQGPADLDRAVDALFAASQARKLADGAFARLDSDLTSALREHPEFQEKWVSHLGGAGGSEGTGTAGVLDDLLEEIRLQRRLDDATAALASAIGTDAGFTARLLHEPGLLRGEGAASSVVADVGEPDLEVAIEQEVTTYTGFVDIAATASYRFGVRASATAEVVLTVDGRTRDLVVAGDLRRTSEAVDLRADRLVEVTLKVEGRDRSARLEWLKGSEGWSQLPPEMLYGAQRLDAVREVLARCLAARRVADVFGLQPSGLHHLARSASLQIDDHGWLSALPVLGSSQLVVLGDVLADLVRFTRLGRGRGVEDELLVGLLQDPGAKREDRLVLADAFGWDTPALSALLEHRRLQPADLGDLGELTRVAEAMDLASSLATPVTVLLQAVTPEPDADAVHLVEAALRARHGAGWLEVIKAVADPLRIGRRDALVAYVLRELRASRPDVDTPEKLLDFFLMDVQMQPPVATSRVRHAISAVQLYVERILMNLEKDEVRPEDLSEPERWQFLKRYRLWEANRQLYLWPENWLEPQLRTDQSPAFRRVMSELLQSDITEDSAATALLGYLSQLEEVAKLEPCAIHEDEGDPNLGDEVSHVVARTPGAQRRYYYRVRDSGSWTAWEQISLDIEDNPVMPVIWKGRLLLFWLRIVNTSPPMPTMDPAAAGRPLVDVSLGELVDPSARNPKVSPKVVLCWSEYYGQRWQPPRTSDVAAPSSLSKDFDIVGENALDRAKVRLGVTIESGVLRVRIWGPDFGTSFLFYNTFSLPQRQEDGPNPGGLMDIEQFASLVREIDPASTLTLSYRGLDLSTPIVRQLIARNDGAPYRITAPYHVGYLPGGDQQGLIQDPWLAPFLYSDGQHAFFVTTSSLDAGVGSGVVLGLPEPKVTRVAPPILTPDELGHDFLLRFPTADLLAGEPGNVILDDVEISPLGRTSRVLPTSQEVRGG